MNYLREFRPALLAIALGFAHSALSRTFQFGAFNWFGGRGYTRKYVTWAAVHIASGALILPMLLAGVLWSWTAQAPRQRRRLHASGLFVGGVLLLWVAAWAQDWIQNTAFPYPPAAYSVLWRLTGWIGAVGILSPVAFTAAYLWRSRAAELNVAADNKLK